MTTLPIDEQCTKCGAPGEKTTLAYYMPGQNFAVFSTSIDPHPWGSGKQRLQELENYAMLGWDPAEPRTLEEVARMDIHAVSKVLEECIVHQCNICGFVWKSKPIQES